MGGLSVPITNDAPNEVHKSGYNFNIMVDYSVSKALVIGGEFDIANNKGTQDVAYFGGRYAKDISKRIVAFDAYLKLQNNLAKKNETQFFVKGGYGIFISPTNDNYLGGGTVLVLGAGLNYLTANYVKLQSAIEYRNNFGSGSSSFPILQFKLGFSFCLNPK